jgi:DNA (cytosine-5)-methyltransferase 1
VSRPKLLDLFCCQGGASAGYVAAGFDVVGVDIDPQPRYPYEFVQADAIEYLAGHSGEFDAIHGSPPCQRFTNAQRIMKNEHPDFITPYRELVRQSGKPYVIENVVGSPLEDPIVLCGAMFGLRTYRHRLFESNADLKAPEHPEHVARVTKMGRRLVEGEFMHVVGNFTGVAEGREIMGMPWASRDGLREAIPPAYAEFVGKQLLEKL